MSEYQYYEFRAVDRFLTPGEMAALRKLTSRATITPSSLVNVYHYGDFRGDPLELMEKYFDLHVYVTNWGTHQLMIRLPQGLLPLDTVRKYSMEEGLEPYRKRDQIIIAFTSQTEDGDWEEGEGWLDRLLPLRQELAGGDLRALYLGWLSGVEMGFGREVDKEPPVPPGLAGLSPALAALVEYLRISDDLLAVAAEKSPRLSKAQPSRSQLEAWVHGLPEGEKDDLLLRVLEGDSGHLGAELLRRFREATSPAAGSALVSTTGRTVGALVAAAEQRAEARRREEEERRAREEERREKERAAIHEAYLTRLATRKEEAWQQVEALVAMRRAQEYDQAVQHLVDLREVAGREGKVEAFDARLNELRAQHARKVTFIERLDHAMAHGLKSRVPIAPV